MRFILVLEGHQKQTLSGTRSSGYGPRVNISEWKKAMYSSSLLLPKHVTKPLQP